MSDYPHAQSAAAKMLTRGLQIAASERNVSLRQIGRQLGYSQPVVLSHMANGRVPIPVDRAPDIAKAVGIPAEPFLEAVLEQRHPSIDWRLLMGTSNPSRSVGAQRIRTLSASHQQILREVMDDPMPEERWISIPEVAVLRLLRELFPKLQSSGLSEEEREALRAAAAVCSNVTPKDQAE